MQNSPTLDDYSAAAARRLFGQRYAIDEQVLSSLLEVALSRGGDYADLYFEHRASSSIAFEEQRVKTASGGITQGVGVRVLSGDSTGYAYTEDLSVASMRQAAATAARICDRGSNPGPAGVTDGARPDRYRVDQPSIEVSSADKLALIRRADEAARAYDPSIIRVNVSFVEEVKHVLV
ncbi:MAG: PmbA/TldA family metallopeptidase, partial [Chloroflexota bacterium]